MATRPHHLNRKELRQPDEFVTFVDQAGDWIVNNLVRAIIAAIAVVIVIVAAVGIHFYIDGRERAAAAQYYRALETLDSHDYKAAAQQFSTLASGYPHTGPGRLARFYVGNALLAENQNAPARDAFQRYLDGEDRPIFREMALMQLGVANENLGNFSAARQNYQQAAALNGPEKGRAERNGARVMLHVGDKAGAISAYQTFLRENPFSPERGEVSEELAALGVTEPVTRRESSSPPPRSSK